jgi:hypothetical protein
MAAAIAKAARVMGRDAFIARKVGERMLEEQRSSRAETIE